MANAKMQKLGFTNAKDRETQARIIMSISGLEKQGKTHFALTAPGPVAMFSSDVGEEGVIEKFSDKDIHIFDVDVDESNDEGAEDEYTRFNKAYNNLLRGTDVRTIVFDTATEVWELLRLARFGQLTQIMPLQYGPVNKEYRDLIREAYKHDKNLILLHKMKKQYVGKGNDAAWNGEYERAGFNDTGFLVQVNAQIYRYSPADGGDFVLWVKDCRQNPDLAGETFEGPMCSFPMLAQQVLPDVDPENWE